MAGVGLLGQDLVGVVGHLGVQVAAADGSDHRGLARGGDVGHAARIQDGDVAGLDLVVAADVVGRGQGDGVGPDRVVDVGRVLGRRGGAVAEVPVPARGLAAGLVAEDDRQGRVSGDRIAGEGRGRSDGLAAADGRRGVDQAVAAVAVPAGARLDVHHVGRGGQQGVANLGRRDAGVVRDDQAADAGRVRSGARGAVEPHIVVAGDVAAVAADVGGRQDRRGQDVHGARRVLDRHAVVRTPPALTVAGVTVRVGVDAGIQLGAAAAAALAVAAGGGRAHADHVLVDRGVADRRHVLVAGGREQGHALVVGVGQGVVGGGIAADRRAEAHAGHVHALVARVVQGVLDRREIHRTGAVGDLQRHHRAAAGRSGHAEIVVRLGRRDAGAAGAVAGVGAVVVGVGVAVAEVVAGDQAQVGMIHIHARVDDRDDHAGVAVAGRRVPGLIGLGVEAGSADRIAVLMAVGGPVVGEHLAGVVVAPLIIVIRVVGHDRGEGAPVDRGGLDVGVGGVALGHRDRIAVGRDRQREPAIDADAGGEGRIRGPAVGPGDRLHADRQRELVDRSQAGLGAGDGGALLHPEIQLGRGIGLGGELDENAPLGIRGLIAGRDLGGVVHGSVGRSRQGDGEHRDRSQDEQTRFFH